MSIRGFSPNFGIQNKQKLLPQPPRYARSEKRFTPQINKSFECYQHDQSITSDRPVNMSFAQLQGKRSVLSNYRDFRLISKLSHRDPQKKQFAAMFIETGLMYMKENNYKAAIESFTKALKDEPSHLKALFHRGKSFLFEGYYKQSITDLLKVITESPNYEKSAYVALASSFFASGDYTSAVRILTKSLTLFPKYKDAFLLRGQLYTHKSHWNKAISDFHKAIRLDPEDSLSYFYLSNALTNKSDYQSSLKALNSAAECPSVPPQVYFTRARLKYFLKDFPAALDDINTYLKLVPLNSEAFYYKALSQVGLLNLSEAALCLEQSIKYDIKKQLTGDALYELASIKVKEKDYYGAMYTFKRAVDAGVNVKEHKGLFRYVEAILALIKRKFKEGLKILKQIVNENSLEVMDYKGNCYELRGYAFAAMEMHEKSVKALLMAAKVHNLNDSSKYNLILSQAVLAAQEKPTIAAELLREASEIYPKNSEPLTYLACIQFRLKSWDKCKKALKKAMKLKPDSSELHFFRGIVSYCEGKYLESTQDLDIAIEKSEDHKVYHYLCRGLSYANLRLFSQAITDFSAVIQLDESIVQAYFYRAQCALQLEDPHKAHKDFETFINFNADSLVYMQIGDQFLLANYIEDALKMYSRSLSLQKSYKVYFQMSKCYLLQSLLPAMITSLTEAQLIEHHIETAADLHVFNSLSLCFQSNFAEALKLLRAPLGDGYITNQRYLAKLSGIYLYYLEEYGEAEVVFQALWDEKSEDSAEILYNLALVNALAGKYDDSLRILNELLYLIEGSNRGKVLILSSIIQLGLKQESLSKSQLKEAFKYDSSSVTSYLTQSSTLTLLPINSNNLTSKLPLKTLSINGARSINVIPSLTLPTSVLPAVSFQHDTTLVQQFCMKNISCKPEPPWLNRVQGNVQFTEEIQEIVGENLAESIAEETEQSVFEDLEAFKKYRSALCLFNGGSEEILRNMQTVLTNEKN